MEYFKIDNPEDFFAPDARRDTLNNFECGAEYIQSAVNEMHEYSAAGRDGWSALLLKECKSSLNTPLYLLWRKSLDTGVIPANLKHANITPQFKGGDRTLPKNYS